MNYNLEPNPKNPLIASFFRNIGMADELGSGVRKLFYYGYRYSGKEPELTEGDIFRIIVPLDDSFSFDVETEKTIVSREKSREKILTLIKANKYITQNEMSELMGLSVKGIEKMLLKLKTDSILERIGPDKGGHWVVK